MSVKNKIKLDYKQLKLSDYTYSSEEEQEEEQEKQEEKQEKQEEQKKKKKNHLIQMKLLNE